MDLSDRMGLGYNITPRAMRRTFNDIARRAGIEGLITRSISGPQDQDIQELYSTLELDERADAVAQVFTLATGIEAAA